MAKKVKIDYRKYSPFTDGHQVPKVVVLHSTESDGKGVYYVKAIGAFLEGKKLSVHYCVAADGAIGQYASPNDKCRHAPPNTGKVGIEQAGFARFTKKKWLSRSYQLLRVARLLAQLNRDYGIPLEFSTTHGVCQHKDLPEGGHHDCGPGYPFYFVLRTARLLRKTSFR